MIHPPFVITLKGKVNHVILLSLSISSKRAQARFFNAVIYLSSKKDSEKRTEAMASLQ